MMPDRRVYPRFNVRWPAQYRTLHSPGDRSRVVVMDMGAEGMCFVSRELFDVGQVIEIQIRLDEQETVVFRTEVIWLARLDHDHFKVSVKIVDGTMGDEIKFIRRYCEKMLAFSRKDKRILIVEDEVDMVRLLEIELVKENYHVICAFDGEDGFEKYLMERPDLVIVDIGIPKINGRQVCRKIRREQNDERTPILMLTARAEDVDRIIGRVIGVQKYVTKPFDTQELLRDIRELLNEGDTLRKGAAYGI